ncbi:Eco57I restriction-modification methylase domain-containing protein [Candidatus Poriferisodalis sp.]|uniref:Eco57I restriction-modification methylase domain-containing protein n=1 Tax=Candidatus Poriferisodalis sp. TaxID=3101277 RepID=UPI003B021757
MDDFLIDRDPQSWSAASGHPSSLVPAHLFVQAAPNGLEVAVATAARKPTVGDLRSAWAARRQKRATPVLLVAFYPSPEAPGGEQVALCGPAGEQPVCHFGVEVSQAERLAEVALREPSHHAATRLLLAALPELDSPFPGLRNSGLLATQELTAGVPMRSDWASASTDSKGLLAHRGRRLVEGLGYEIATLATNASVLTIAGRREAIAVFCDDSEPFEAPSDRFDGMSPVSRALALADRENIDWVLLTRASEIRLYSARPGVGVGRKGRAETFVELNLSLLAAEQAGYLALLFSAEAISANGSLHEVLAASERFAADLAVRLRKRIYFETVPALARAVASRLGVERHGDMSAGEVSEADLDSAYEQVMVILFRLLFVAYAEDKDLLPYRSNGRYADHSLTRLAQRLAQTEHSVHAGPGSRLGSGRSTGADPGPTRNDTTADTAEEACAEAHFDERATDLWDDVRALWDAVNWGNDDWGVPAYNGGLFSDDPAVSPTGAAIAALRLTNAEFGPALAAALVDHGAQGPGPVDFRSLSVREFGTIYEGLLESKLSVATDDLAVKQAKGAEQYVPAGANDEVEVLAGEVYFHNLSGARKATGSYFTKPFAVEHLLDHALEPALDDHLARLDVLRDSGDDAGVAAAFFDFRCADIAMGSAHFLVAAVDRIEARLSAWLSLHPVPAVTAELNRLRNTAMSQLGDLGDGVEIETGSLLRRQIARHCIYGVDKNRVAVELARLAIWVHTFVPGLPLSFLDHNFVHGDSLTGVASTEDGALAVRPKGDKSQPSLFVHQLENMIDAVVGPLERLARLNDADKAEVAAAREAHVAARAAVRTIDDVFDVATAVRAGMIEIQRDFDFAPGTIAALAHDPRVRDAIERLQPVHYPTTWPEVFSRGARSGFDCLVGNPPWEKVVVDREVWYGMHLPGVRSLPVAQRREQIDKLEADRPDLAVEFERERERAEFLKLILRAAFPRLGTGQTDLYKAFAWANLNLCRADGMLGVVLPRTAVSDAGMANWRREIVSIDGGGGDTLKSRSQPLSTTGAGCSREYTTHTRWCWPRPPAPHGRQLPQYQTVGIRRRRRPIHHRSGRRPQAEPAN